MEQNNPSLVWTLPTFWRPLKSRCHTVSFKESSVSQSLSSILSVFLLLNTDQHQNLSFGSLYVKIRSAMQKLWTKSDFVPFLSQAFRTVWQEKCVCFIQNTLNWFLRVPNKCFPQSSFGVSYLNPSFWWCPMYLSRQQAQVPFQIGQIRTVWHFEVSMKKFNYIGNG